MSGRCILDSVTVHENHVCLWVLIRTHNRSKPQLDSSRYRLLTFKLSSLGTSVKRLSRVVVRVFEHSILHCVSCHLPIMISTLVYYAARKSNNQTSLFHHNLKT